MGIELTEFSLTNPRPSCKSTKLGTLQLGGTALHTFSLKSYLLRKNIPEVTSEVKCCKFKKEIRKCSAVLFGQNCRTVLKFHVSYLFVGERSENLSIPNNILSDILLTCLRWTFFHPYGRNSFKIEINLTF